MNTKGLARLFRDMLNNDPSIDFTSSDTPSLLPAVDDTRLLMGDGTNSWDLRWFGNAGTAYLEIDASASLVQCVGAMAFNVPVGQFKLGGTAVTATAAEINAKTAAASRLVNVTDAATYTVLAADSGKIHIMPNFTSTCTLALPAASAGLEYVFIAKAIAADAQNWVFQVAEAGVSFLGGLSFLDTDAGAGADEVHLGVFPNGSSNDFMTIVTPTAGTRIYMINDGTNWIVNGQVFSATVPTFSDT